MDIYRKPKFEILNTDNILDNIKRVATLYDKNLKVNKRENLLKDLIHKEKFNLLNHNNICMTVDAETYCSIYDYVIDSEYSVYSDPDADLTSTSLHYIKMTEMYLNGEDRFTLSGNLTEWINTMDMLWFKWNLYFKSISEILYKVTGSALDLTKRYDIDIKDFECEVDKATLVTDFNKLTETERLIHERISVIFTLDNITIRDMYSFNIKNSLHTKISNEIFFIKPAYWLEGSVGYLKWKNCCETAYENFNKLLNSNTSIQEASFVLNGSVGSEFIITLTLSEWRSFINKVIIRYNSCESDKCIYTEAIIFKLCKELKENYQFILQGLNMD